MLRVYAVGLGRSGTTSIAKQLKGTHEPPGSLDRALEYHFTGRLRPIRCEDEVISDSRQTFLADTLEGLIIWLVRDYEDWLASAKKFPYRTIDRFFEGEDKHTLFWIYVHLFLWDALKGKRFVICRTEDLVEWENRS